MSAILVVAEPGCGKSVAVENLDPATTVIIKPNAKQLPFPGAAVKYVQNKNSFILKTFKGVGDTIDQVNKAANIKTIVLEDFTHYMSKDVMDRAADKGYDKWTELAVKIFNNIIEKAINGLRPDLDFVFIAHASAVGDASGNMEIGMQTVGKLLDNAIKIPSYFTYIFHGLINYEQDEPRYWFQTNRDNVRLAKSPKGCFPMFIPNDYKAIFDRIHAYELGKLDQCVIEPANK
jgi:hypothetical protein